jgi:hypothetical protein
VPPTSGFYTKKVIPAEVDDKSIDVYPNPANSYFIVYNYAGVENRKIELLDLNGRIVSRKNSSSLTSRIETGALSSGFYILNITDSKGKIIRKQKMVIQH